MITPAFLARMGNRLLVALADLMLKPFGGRIDVAYPKWDECSGDPDCTASPHYHGCYADLGNCEHPEEHKEDADV